MQILTHIFKFIRVHHGHIARSMTGSGAGSIGWTNAWTRLGLTMVKRSGHLTSITKSKSWLMLGLSNRTHYSQSRYKKLKHLYLIFKISSILSFRERNERRRGGGLDLTKADDIC
jgi:hypothetical protein